MGKEAIRELIKADRYYLLVKILGRKDALHPWVYERCREVEAAPDGYIDIWAREHFKSSVITNAGVIQEVVRDPDITVGIFSHTAPIAKGFLAQIKREFEFNQNLLNLFPEIFWDDPQRQSPSWSLDNGIIVKRSGNPKECTVEAHGLVDGQPTALDVATPVLTTAGWKPHGDLAVGDWVFGSNGAPVMVIYNTGPMYDKDCREVVFTDSSMIASSDHLWPVDRMIGKRNPVTGKQDLGWSATEREIVKTDELPLSTVVNRDKRRRLPRSPIIEFNDRDISLDPYVLGVWLGDGTAVHGIVTSADTEIISHIEAAGFKCTIHRDNLPCINTSEVNKAKMYQAHGLRTYLRKLDLIDNKHIPNNYMFSSVSTRRALLQGLMDTDGSVNRNYGQCSFYNTNLSLVEGVRFLSASLGLQPSNISSRDPKCDRHKRCYHVTFTATQEEAVFRLKRKLNLCILNRERQGRYVRKINKIMSVPVNCIQVDAPDGLYLAGRSLVVTHNSKHYRLLVYDDVVTDKSVYTPDQILKTNEAFSLSDNLGSIGGRKWICGTRYNHQDTYADIISRGAAIPRIYPATDSGQPEGNPVLFTPQDWEKKKRDQLESTISTQMLCNPLAGKQRIFNVDDLQVYEVRPMTLMGYLMIDPARSVKKDSANTAMVVIGIDAAGNKYFLDGVAHKMDLMERWRWMRDLWDRWHRETGIMGLKVGYERYGAIADLQYFQERQKIEKGCNFEITELEWPREGPGSKRDRIQRLVPDIKGHHFYLPYPTDEDRLTSVQRRMLANGYGYRIAQPIKRIDENDNVYDVIDLFKTEVSFFPYGGRCDSLDAASRLYDLDPIAPAMTDEEALEPEFT